MNKPIAFFSKKLSSAKQRYTITEKELLNLIDTPKEFEGVLLDKKSKVYIDDKNLVRDALGLNNDWVMR